MRKRGYGKGGHRKRGVECEEVGGRLAEEGRKRWRKKRRNKKKKYH